MTPLPVDLHQPEGALGSIYLEISRTLHEHELGRIGGRKHRSRTCRHG